MTTKADKARLDAIHNMPCVCCESMKVSQPSPTEANHDVSNGYRRLSGGHQATSGLCGWHHRADNRDNGVLTPERVMYHKYGPSMKYQSKGEFELCFGTQGKLVEITTEQIEGVTT